MNHRTGEVRKSWCHGYTVGAVTGLLLCIGIVAVKGGPFWPPFALLFMAGVGVVGGLASVASLRRWEGLSVIPVEERDAQTELTEG